MNVPHHTAPGWLPWPRGHVLTKEALRAIATRVGLDLDLSEAEVYVEAIERNLAHQDVPASLGR
jgi:hypothetical protein